MTLMSLACIGSLMYTSQPPEPVQWSFWQVQVQECIEGILCKLKTPNLQGVSRWLSSMCWSTFGEDRQTFPQKALSQGCTFFRAVTWNPWMQSSANLGRKLRRVSWRWLVSLVLLACWGRHSTGSQTLQTEAICLAPKSLWWFKICELGIPWTEPLFPTSCPSLGFGVMH